MKNTTRNNRLVFHIDESVALIISNFVKFANIRRKKARF